MTISSPSIYVLFGATGDLAQRKIIPALYVLYNDSKLSHDFQLIAFSRRPWTDNQFRDFIKPALNKTNPKQAAITQFLKQVSYVSGTFNDAKAFNVLKEKIDGYKPEQVFYHLAIQNSFYGTVAEHLDKAGLDYPDKSVKAKILIEKPIGQDGNSAQLLEKKLEHYFDLVQIFRIDHYLTKPGLELFLKERKENKDFENKLNNAFVNSITIRMLEKIDIEGRGEFYDPIGALRDTGQNHVLEMLAHVAMDIKNSSVHEARAQVLKKLKKPDEIVIGQYAGYVQERDVKSDSKTETYFKVKTEILNERWKGVDVILEAGKAFSRKRNEIEIQYKDGSRNVFDIEKGEGTEAYEILVEKACQGDKDSFVSKEEIEASWIFIDSVRKTMNTNNLIIYKKGITEIK